MHSRGREHHRRDTSADLESDVARLHQESKRRNGGGESVPASRTRRVECRSVREQSLDNIEFSIRNHHTPEKSEQRPNCEGRIPVTQQRQRSRRLQLIVDAQLVLPDHIEIRLVRSLPNLGRWCGVQTGYRMPGLPDIPS